MKSKKQTLILIVMVVAVAAMLAAYFLTRPQAVFGPKEFTLVIVHKDGQTKEQTLTTREEYLGAFLEAEGIIEGEEGPYGMYIRSVDGEKAVYEEDNAYWAFYVGDDYANVGANETVIAGGETYKFVYTTM